MFPLMHELLLINAVTYVNIIPINGIMLRKEMHNMARRPKKEYENWIHLLSETSAVRELLAAELENLSQDCNMELMKKAIIESPETGDRITRKIFDTFIELIGIKIMESPDKEFYIPKFGTFAVKTHRGHKVTLNPREDDGPVVNLPDYKMLRFKPDDKFKSDILLTDAPSASLESVNVETEDTDV